MGGKGRVFTLEEVAKHNTHDDCWLIIYGKVYDVSKFMDDHPGGDEALLAATGRDATEDFDDVRHSSSAKATMEEMYIGDIDTGAVPTKTVEPAAKGVSSSPERPPRTGHGQPNDIFQILKFLIPLAILGLAIALRSYTKSA